MRVELTNLTCNDMDTPIGLGTPDPSFSWHISSPVRGVKQTAYRMLVATTREGAEAGAGDMWDPGWITSDRSVHVSYEGRPLTSDTSYFWCVAIRDNQENETAWATGTFTTALLNQSDWEAAFIGPEEIHDSTTKIKGTDKASILRREFTATGVISSARAFFSGLGWGELYINGKRVNDNVLDPAPTDYRFSVPYVVCDVTAFLTKGCNSIGIFVGNGWFSEYGWVYAYGWTPKAMLQIHITYEDGTAEKWTTDTSWKTINGPILENRLWGGEYYDAREDQEGWTVPGFDDAHWQQAVRKDRCQGLMKAQEMPPVRVMNTIMPIEMNPYLPTKMHAAIAVERNANTPFVLSPMKEKSVKNLICIRIFDMQVLFGGWSRIHVKGVRGQVVRIRHSDRLDAHGFVDQQLQLSGGPCDRYYTHADNKACTDVYVLKGAPDGEIWEPRFTFHPVRYVQVEYDPTMVALIGMEGRHTHQDLDFSSTFSCSNELFSRIHQAVVQTLKNQSFGIPLDCLNREHWGWVDPASIAGTLYPRQYMPLFWKKWMADIRESQYANGAIPDIAPLYVQDFRTPDPIWGGSFVRLVWFYYQYYQDESVLHENYESLTRLFAYHSLHVRDGILTEGTYGDHMIPGDAPGHEEFISSETSAAFLWTGWYFECARTLSRMAQLLGRNEEEIRYAAIAEKTYKVVNQTWFNEQEAFYDKGSQTAQYYALAAGLVPQPHREAVLKRAISDLQNNHHGNHHTGNTGTTAMLDALGDAGYADILHSMINRTSYPGWGYMIDHGATTIWESWSTENGVGCELSMTMYTTVDEFFFNELAGIKGPGYFGDSLFDKPGFQSVVIAPHMPHDMTHAHAAMQTVYGRLASGWERKTGKTFLHLLLPGNTDGAIRLPHDSGMNVTENGKTVWADGVFFPGIEGITAAFVKDRMLTIAVGSGTYLFKVTYT